MNKNKFLALGAIVLGTLAFTACSSDDEGPATAELSMEVVGLETLTAGARYEGWIVVDGTPVSTGTFTSTTNNQTFRVNAAQLNDATEFIISIESDNDPAPSDTKLLSGSFNGNQANLNVNALVADFSNSSVSGKFVIASPTDDNAENEENGIWFMDPNGAVVSPGLSLPTLQKGWWSYEGWVVFNGIPVTTGKFKNIDGPDASSPYSGNLNAPPFPGEDFLNNAPSGLTFPADGDVRGKEVLISIEPDPDYDQATPFFVKPLKGMAGQALAPEISIMAKNDTGPIGKVTRP